MSRHEIRRFVYMCDGAEHSNKRCPSTQAVDAVNEQEADRIARDRGWRIDGKSCLCNSREHKKWSPRPDRTAGLPSLKVVDGVQS